MSTSYIVVTVLASAWVGFSAASVFFRAKWVVQPLAAYGVPVRGGPGSVRSRPPEPRAWWLA
jgi:hypothetical protein